MASIISSPSIKSDESVRIPPSYLGKDAGPDQMSYEEMIDKDEMAEPYITPNYDEVSINNDKSSINEFNLPKVSNYNDNDLESEALNEQSDIYVPSEQSDVYVPSEQSDVYVPSEQSDVYVPSEQSDVYVPSEQSDVYVPSETESFNENIPNVVDYDARSDTSEMSSYGDKNYEVFLYLGTEVKDQFDLINQSKMKTSISDNDDDSIYSGDYGRDLSKREKMLPILTKYKEIYPLLGNIISTFKDRVTFTMILDESQKKPGTLSYYYEVLSEPISDNKKVLRFFTYDSIPCVLCCLCVYLKTLFQEKNITCYVTQK